MTEPTPSVFLITMDHQHGGAVLWRSDGKSATLPTPAVAQLSSRISRSHFSPGVPALVIETTLGDTIRIELPSDGARRAVDSRPVVYLDQNKWSLLARAIHEPDGLPTAERSAALKLATMAADAKVRLPISAGHFSETAKWKNDEARYHLGVTMLRLSVGWGMRDPIDVRRWELGHALRAMHGKLDPPQPEVFTLDATAVFGERGATSPYVPSEGLDVETRGFLSALANATVLVDVLLDLECVEQGSVAGWADTRQRQSDWLASETQRTAQQKRQSAEVFSYDDMGLEIARAAHASGVTPDEMSTWFVKRRTVDIAVAPCAGAFHELMIDRLVNPTTAWKENDLTDMFYLACAMGYANYVVAERHTTAMLNQGARRLGRTERAFRSFHDLAQSFRHDGLLD